MWLAPGIIVMQFATVFFPIFEIFEQRNSMLKRVDSFSSTGSTLRAISFISEKGDRRQPRTSTSDLFDELNSASVGRLYSMLALERALIVNPTPLLHYAAKKDFTAENIVFLTSVRDWRQAWASAPRNPDTGTVTEDAQVRLFKMAVEIFAESVDEKTADFPINIEGHMRKELARIFSPDVLNGLSGFAVRNIRDRAPPSLYSTPPATPWADQKKAGSVTTTVTATPPSSADTTFGSLSSNNSAVKMVMSESKPYRLEDRPDLSPQTNGRGIDIPGFDEHVFDEAESSIKYLVLTNTWRKFVELRERDEEGGFDFGF